MRDRRTAWRCASASKAESVDSPVSANIDMIMCCYQCLEVVQASQHVAVMTLADDLFSSISPEAMKAVISLRPEDSTRSDSTVHPWW